jgi:hypothetical protein
MKKLIVSIIVTVDYYLIKWFGCFLYPPHKQGKEEKNKKIINKIIKNYEK